MSTLAARTDPDPARAWRWYGFQLELLTEAQRYLAALSYGANAGGGPRSYERHFVGQTVDQVDAFFTAQQAELELLTILELLASVEASLRLDFHRRISGRRKDRMARKFRSFKNPERVRLDEDILEAWCVLNQDALF